MASTAAVALEASARHVNPVTAPPDQREGLAALLQLLRPLGSQPLGVAEYKLVSHTGEVVALPESISLLLGHMVEVLARGDGVAVVPVSRELTSLEAARILNVSRQYLVRLLDSGRIPSRKTGTHRRVRMSDVLAYKRQRDHERMASLDALSQLSQEFGGYDEIPTDG
jgi:excisionase family DNA binding protein